MNNPCTPPPPPPPGGERDAQTHNTEVDKQAVNRAAVSKSKKAWTKPSIVRSSDSDGMKIFKGGPQLDPYTEHATYYIPTSV